MKNLLAGLGAIAALMTCGAFVLDDARFLLLGLGGAILVGLLVSRANRRAA